MESSLQTRFSPPLLSVLFFLVFFALLFPIHLIGGDSHQWDFYSYYFAAKARNLGLNPYEFPVVQSLTDRHLLPYVYHPFTLALFQIFTTLEAERAFTLYLLLSLLLLAFAFYSLVASGLLPARHALLSACVLVFGFGGSYPRALASGNPALFEAPLAWIAMSAFVMDRRGLFYSAIILWGIFKGTPFMFLALPLLTDRRPGNLRNFCIVSICVSSGFFLPDLVEHETFTKFLSAANGVNEVGRINPSSYSLIQSIVASAGLRELPISAKSLFIVWVTIVGGTGAVLLRKCSLVLDRREQVFLAVLVHALIAPRFKDYAFMQLLPLGVMSILQFPGIVVLIFFEQMKLTEVTWLGQLGASWPLGVIIIEYLPLLSVMAIAGLLLPKIFRHVMSNEPQRISSPETRNDLEKISSSLPCEPRNNFELSSLFSLASLIFAYLAALWLSRS